MLSNSEARVVGQSTVWMQGSQIGRYQISRLLARGGMGEIFLAKESLADGSGATRPVVLKRLIGATHGTPDQVKLFLEEARIASLLRHEDIVEVYEVGSFEGTYFIAMEHLEGRDMRAILKRILLGGTKVPLEPAVAMAIGALAGMHHAHELTLDGEPLHIVHRDISPQNLFVTYDGRVKLLDFGVAKTGRKDRETTTRTLRGKVPYMSPEQCLSRPLDRRSDVFSLSVILYELTVGARLFRGNSDYELMQQIVQGQVVAPTALDAAYPAALEAVVMRSLQKPIEKRFPSAEAMRAELEAVARELGWDVSAAAIARFMRETFGDEPEPEPSEPRPAGPEEESPLGTKRETVKMPLVRQSRPTPSAPFATLKAEHEAPTAPSVHAVSPTAGPAGGQSPGQSGGQATVQSGGQVTPKSNRHPIVPVLSAAPTLPSVQSVRPVAPAKPKGEVGSGALWAMALAALLVFSGVLALALKTRNGAAASTTAPPAMNIAARPAAAPVNLPVNIPVNAPVNRPVNINPPAPSAPPVNIEAPAPREATPPLAVPVVQAAPFGTIVVVSDHRRAAFFLDGRRVANAAPFTLKQIESGREHQISEVRGGGKHAELRFTLAPGEVKTLNLGKR